MKNTTIQQLQTFCTTFISIKLSRNFQTLRIIFVLSTLFFSYSKGKSKGHPVQALRLCTGRTAYRQSRGTVLPFHYHGIRRGVGSASRPGRSLPPGKTRYPLSRGLGGSQGRPGEVRKISPQPGFDPRIVHLVASRYTEWATRPFALQ